MAFNAVYGHEAHARELTSVRAAVQHNVSALTARALLRDVRVSINRIVSVPPGDMRIDPTDPQFRRSSRELRRVYEDVSAGPVDRLAAVAGMLYQVRCNLIHGSKDPVDPRDTMLVHESVQILERLVPAVEPESP
jgi:hypothetical protein